MNFAKGGDRPWKDIRFREAVYRLTRRQQAIDLVLAGKAVVPPGPIHASLEAYQLDKSATDKYFKEDAAAAKQLLSAMNYNTGDEWVISTSNTSAQNASLAEVWQQQLSQGDIKLRVEAVPLAELLPKKMQPAQFDIFVGSQPGGDTPFRAIRNQHSDTLDQFNNVGLFDPKIDALIEDSEQATDREENIKLVKQVQTEALDRYSLSYLWATANTYFFYNSKLQNWEIDPLAGQNYQLNAWLA
jgi:ABC-type transport system substrate-binding protein